MIGYLFINEQAGLTAKSLSLGTYFGPFIHSMAIVCLKTHRRASSRFGHGCLLRREEEGVVMSVDLGSRSNDRAISAIYSRYTSSGVPVHRSNIPFHVVGLQGIPSLGHAIGSLITASLALHGLAWPSCNSRAPRVAHPQLDWTSHPGATGSNRPVLHAV